MLIRGVVMSARWFTFAGFLLVAACSDSSGPGDTTISLILDPVTSPTNQIDPTISGTTDAGATVTVTGPLDTLSAVATSGGGFSITVTLRANAFSDLAVAAVDSAGNRTADTVSVLHDNRSPDVDFTAPAAATAGQSGFAIELEFSEDTFGVAAASGLDLSTFEVVNSREVGGAFRQDGTFSTTIAAGENLAVLFSSVDESGASLSVPDSALFPPGTNELTARISDLAGNLSSAALASFQVTADPDRLILVDAGGSAGSSGNPLSIGLVNADSVGGVQFDLTFSTSVIASVDSVTVGDRATAFDGIDFNEIQPGQVRVILFDNGGDVIPPGQGPILTLWLSVDGSAASGTHTLSVDSALLSDGAGNTTTLPASNGVFTVP